MICYMRSHQKQLRQLIRQALYVVDERAVADAMLARARFLSSPAGSMRKSRRPWWPESRSLRPEPGEL
jgi:hypothetical protein